MTQVPCANECLGNVCNVTPTGPAPPLLPPPSGPDDPHAPGCKCDPSRKSREIDKIIDEEWEENDKTLGWAPYESAGLKGLELLLEHLGIELDPWSMGAEIPLLLTDLYEVEEHHNEAMEKWRKLDEDWAANCP
jgi:hypothetical protein